MPLVGDSVLENNHGGVMKIRRIWGIISVSLATVLLTSGCIKLEMDMTVATDDTVSGTMIFAISKSLAEMGAEESETSSAPETDNVFAGAENVTVEPFDDGEFVGSSYEFENLPLAQFAPQVGDNSAFAIERQGDNLVVSGVLDSTSESEQLEENPFADSLTEGFAATTSIKVSVTLPGEIIETNGEVEGQTITWNGAFGEKLDLQAVAVSPLSGPVNWLLVGGAAGLLLGIIGVLFIWLTGRKKKAMNSVESGKSDSKSSKTKKQTKAEILAAEALASRPWYQKKRFAFPAIGLLAGSFLAIAVGLLQPQAGSSNADASNPSPSTSESSQEVQEGDSQQPAAPAPVAPAAPAPVAPKAAPAPVTREAPAVIQSPSETEGQFLARQDALYYWADGWYSRTGLINWLMAIGYSYEDSVYGTDSLGADWSYDALLGAEDLISQSFYSRLGLIFALEDEGFTTAEATSGVDQMNYDWYQEAYALALDYIVYSGYTEQEANDQLIAELFTADEASWGSSLAAQG